MTSIESRAGVAASARKAYAANPEKFRQSRRRWVAANPEKAAETQGRYAAKHGRDQQARRRAALAGAPRIEKIDRAEIYERDGGLCAICGNHVPRASFTLDHITPLSKGGSHTYDNLTVAHGVCNLSKGNRNTPTQRPLFPRL